MAEIYSIENVEEIVGYDEYIKDFEEQAKEYCKDSAIKLLQSIFSEFTVDTECSVYLDSEQTKARYPISFNFNITLEGQLIVSYLGYY